MKTDWINKELADCFVATIKNTKDANIKNVLKYLKSFVLNGGKRIRPLSMLMVYEDLTSINPSLSSEILSHKVLPYKALPCKEHSIDKHTGKLLDSSPDPFRGDLLKIAVAIEILHNATLCHDDIMDEDALRRGKPSCHKEYQSQYLKNFKETAYKGDIFSKESMRYGTSVAIMGGNILNNLAYGCIIQSGFDDSIIRKVLDRFIDTIIKINYGQVQDMSFEKSKDVSQYQYLDMIKNKTASLLGCSIEMGGLLAGKDSNTLRKLYKIGMNLGITFQIIDDLIDIDPNKKKGNTFGSDIINYKKTILSVYTAGKNPEFASREMCKKDMTKRTVDKIILMYHKIGAVKYARGLAAKNTKKAVDLMAELKLKQLPKLADTLLRRVS
jgi:geranylgeranyl pyrophosphate synthase